MTNIQMKLEKAQYNWLRYPTAHNWSALLVAQNRFKRRLKKFLSF
jgi:hypothetical protein